MPVYVSRLSQWIEKRWNAKGGNVITDIDTVGKVTLAFPVGIEDRYLQGWNRFSQTAQVAANAANSSATRLRNPAGSNVICVVERLYIQNAVATLSLFQVQRGTATTDLTTPNLGFRDDPRGNPNSATIMSFQNTTPANLTANIYLLQTSQVGKDVIVTTDTQILILPGDAIQVVDTTVNEQMFVNWTWRERALELSELT